MDLERLLRDPPALHLDRHGRAAPWRASDALLRALDDLVEDGSTTLETGAGVSTLVFALKRCHHTAVTPVAEEAERILAWCRAHDVPTDRLRFELGRSEEVLPRVPQEPLDLVLIDGAHGFPAPFVDWLYAGRRLRVGGTVLVDDTQIWTGRLLRDFLAAEPQWSIMRERRLEFVAARRVAEGPVGEWGEQPYVLRRSFTPNSSSVARRAVGIAVGVGRVAAAVAGRVRRGEWRALAGALRGRRGR